MNLKYIRFWFPLIVYSGIIFCVSSIPKIQAPLGEMHSDKILHALEYMVFGFLLARALGLSYTDIPVKKLVIYSFLGAFLYGASDEFHQSFVPGRSADVFDLMADTIGGGIGGYVYSYLLKGRKTNSNDMH